MDLMNGQITVGALLQNPRAYALLKQEMPALAGSPILAHARGMTLNQAMAFGRRYMNPQKMNSLLNQLKAL